MGYLQVLIEMSHRVFDKWHGPTTSTPEDTMGYLRKPLDESAIVTLTIMASHPPYCDFCGDSKPLYVYASSRTSNGILMDCWRWCACYDCAESVESENWDLIIAKLTIKLRKILPQVPAYKIQCSVRRSMYEFHTYSVKRAH